MHTRYIKRAAAILCAIFLNEHTALASSPHPQQEVILSVDGTPGSRAALLTLNGLFKSQSALVEPHISIITEGIRPHKEAQLLEPMMPYPVYSGLGEYRPHKYKDPFVASITEADAFKKSHTPPLYCGLEHLIHRAEEHTQQNPLHVIAFSPLLTLSRVLFWYPELGQRIRLFVPAPTISEDFSWHNSAQTVHKTPVSDASALAQSPHLIYLSHLQDTIGVEERWALKDYCFLSKEDWDDLYQTNQETMHTLFGAPNGSFFVQLLHDPYTALVGLLCIKHPHLIHTTKTQTYVMHRKVGLRTYQPFLMTSKVHTKPENISFLREWVTQNPYRQALSFPGAQFLKYLMKKGL